MALELLAADIEQCDPGRHTAKHGAGKISAHEGKLDKIFRIAFDIGAKVEHHRLAARGRQDGGDGRTVDARHHAERNLRHRHQRAGIPGRDDSPGLPIAHGVDRKTHTALAALAERLTGLVL